MKKPHAKRPTWSWTSEESGGYQVWQFEMWLNAFVVIALSLSSVQDVRPSTLKNDTNIQHYFE